MEKAGSAMLKLLADENLHSHIWKGVRRQVPEVDFIRAQDVEALSGLDDPLEWAAQNGRVLLTHDLRTMHGFGLTTAGVIFVPQPFLLAAVIHDLVLVLACYAPEELAEQTFLYLPFS